MLDSSGSFEGPEMGSRESELCTFSSTNGWMFPTRALCLSPLYRKFYTVSGTL